MVIYKYVDNFQTLEGWGVGGFQRSKIDFQFNPIIVGEDIRISIVLNVLRPVL